MQDSPHVLECAQAARSACVVSLEARPREYLLRLTDARELAAIGTAHREAAPHLVFGINVETIRDSHKPRERDEKIGLHLPYILLAYPLQSPHREALFLRQQIPDGVEPIVRQSVDGGDECLEGLDAPCLLE